MSDVNNTTAEKFLRADRLRDVTERLTDAVRAIGNVDEGLSYDLKLLKPADINALVHDLETLIITAERARLRVIERRAVQADK
jgi:hypothetical protein